MTSMPADPALARPRLAPGAPLLRRDAHTLQLGTSPGVRFADRPGLARLLRLLDGSLSMTELRGLVRRDVPELTDDLDRTLNHLAAIGVILLHPTPTTRPVAVRHDRSAGELARLIVDGLGGAGPPEPRIEVLVSAGEPPRTPFETLSVARVPHLPVVLTEDRVRLGPFVMPGDSPCLGCLDAQLAATDPAWSALLPQFDRPRLLTVAVPRTLQYETAAEIVHEVDLLLAGRRPATLGHVLWLGPDHGARDLHAVPFAEGCACRLLAV